MNDERLFSLRNRWFTTSVAITVGIVLTSAVVGFVWLPSVQTDAPFQGVWNAICSAAGVPNHWLTDRSLIPVAISRSSVVTMTPQLLSDSNQMSNGRGAMLAARCLGCHGANQPIAPRLAGQDSAFVYKQLLDFRAGARSNPVMTIMAASLNDQDMQDLATYFHSLPGKSSVPVREGLPPAVVLHGDPLRNIAACAVCHGGIDHKAGAPRLDGMTGQYLQSQLEAFANGMRHNDINEQMRNIARNMTHDEVVAAARFYAENSEKGSP